MGFFDISDDEFVIQLLPSLLPVRLRKPRLLAMAAAMLHGLQQVITRFLYKRADSLYDLAHNGQVQKLEAVLQDIWGEGVYIGEYSYADYVWLFLRAEVKPVGLYRREEAKPLYVFKRDEVVEGGVFVVNVPSGLEGFDEARCRALLRKYKLAGMAYVLVYYSV